MKKTLSILILISCFTNTISAAHIFGGEMIYVYLGPGTAPNSKNYRITLKLFRDNSGGGAALPTSVFIGIFDYGTKQHYPASQTFYDVPITSGPNQVPMNVSPCATGNTFGDYSVAEYSFSVDLPNNPQGYICVYETCCRINGIQNVFNTAGPGGAGSTYVCRIPGTNQLPVNQHNSSPQFVTRLDLVCRNIPFTWNFSATDPDGDSLVYSFTPAYDKTIAQNAANVPPAPPAASPPPDYPFLTYINGFSGTNPLGSSVTINSSSGIISGVAPGLGLYVTGVIIREFRNGVQISEHRKDFILRVQDCDVPQATLTPRSATCDGFTLSFENATPGPLINSYFWDFGVPWLTDDTSNLQNPTYTYPDTGVYIVKLVTNRNQQCSDSTTRIERVFPGFFPGFISNGACFQNPFQFTDTTNTRYGVVDSWRWDFGETTSFADTSRLQNPQYTYPAPGPKDVRLIVTNSKGCIDTAMVTINVLDKPPLSLAFTDTLICRNDALQLNATGTGVFNWTPPVNITGANTATPTVSPTSTQWYYVDLDDNGCVNRDSVRVRVIGQVTLNAMPDTTICRGDAIQLNAVSDGLSFSWSPAGNLNNPNIINPIAVTTNTTTYTVVATVGSCSTTDFVTVTTIPYPGSNAGPDRQVCYNTSGQLNASIVGSSFVWSPASYLDNPNILNPVATPPRTTQYVLAVYDTLGCPKPGLDTVVIVVNPKVRAFAGNDTSVVVGQPLQLNGSGGVSYLWSPATGLSSTTIANPVGVYTAENDSIRYKLVVRDGIGCPDSAYVTVYVYKTNPYVFVPSAFTPNNDGLNDIIRPISVGIREIRNFSIFNRWGERVFYTTRDRHGWDGIHNGRPQASGVYVWMLSAIDYTGRPLFLKGTVTLIR